MREGGDDDRVELRWVVGAALCATDYLVVVASDNDNGGRERDVQAFACVEVGLDLSCEYAAWIDG